MSIIDKRVQFEEMCKNYEEGTITGFFTIDKSLLEEMYPNQYPEAIAGKLSVDISMEQSMCISDNCNAICSISPVEYNANNNEYDCYNWFDVYLPQDEVKELINIIKEELE
jgi:hypothetical protein